MSVSPAHLETLAAISVDPVIFERWPSYQVLALVAEDVAVPKADEREDAESPLDLAERQLRERGVEDWRTEPHLAAWMQAYSDFGAKPKRTSPSALALAKRAAAGLPRIDPLTDLYNAISVAHLMPIGGEDLDTYRGAPHLTIARGDEPFDTVEKGEAVIDHPAPGEVIWRDDLGVTCRRWNWRQCVRTRITGDTRTVIFLLEALAPLSGTELQSAGEELMEGLRILVPQVVLESRIIAAS